ncbi:MAG: enoyl-CoA hydratase-related protein [Pseudomonadota bacterium]
MANESFATIETATEQGVRILRLNRPERLNAWTYQMGRELAQAVAAANEDEAVLGIVVTGNGRGFCAGADIEAVFKAQADGDSSRGNEATGDDPVGRWVEQLRASKPIAAAINGAAIGVGLTQVLPMDYLLASPEAKLSVRFVQMGLVPELASSHFLAARLGFGAAAELMLTGRPVSGAAARQKGLIDRLVPAAELVDEAVSVVAGMGRNPLLALRHTKALLTANATATDLDAVQHRELAALAECYQSAEHHEAIAAFMEKRAPDFAKARERDR